MKSTVVDESLSSYKPMYCSREYQASTREPHILEVFKNTLPTKLYLILFPIEDLRQTAETAKRILTKEKLEQSSSSPFMSTMEGHSRRVSFNMREELGNKVDKLTVMVGKLAAEDREKAGPFKPQMHQSRGRGQNGGSNQRNYQDSYRSDNRLSSRDRGQFRQGRGRHRFKQSCMRNYRENPRNYG